MTSAQLKAAIDNLVGEAGTVFDSNENRPGRWRELADAAEALAGETSSANDNIAGYMKRATVALEILGGTSGAEENTTYFGYLKRMVDALEAWNGAVGTGSLTDRFRAAGSTFTTALIHQEAIDLVARMSIEPAAVRSRKIDELVGELKAAGVWTKLDALYVMAAHNEQAAKLNWIADAFNIADPGATAPTFTADRGFTGDGASDYLDTTFNPATAAGLFTQNSCHMAIWVGTEASSSTLIDIGNSSAQINTRSSATSRIKGQSTSVNAPTLGAVSIGLTAFSRTVSTGYNAFRNATAPVAVTQASTALISLPFYLLAVSAAGPAPANFSTRRLQAACFGSGLTDTEMADLYTALNTYMQAVAS